MVIVNRVSKIEAASCTLRNSTRKTWRKGTSIQCINENILLLTNAADTPEPMVEAEEYTLDVEVELPTYSRRFHRIEQRQHRKHSVAVHILFTQKASTHVNHQIVSLKKNVSTKRLKWRPMLQQMLESALRPKWQVSVTSDIQEIQSSDWHKWLCTLWRKLIPAFPTYITSFR